MLEQEVGEKQLLERKNGKLYDINFISFSFWKLSLIPSFSSLLIYKNLMINIKVLYCCDNNDDDTRVRENFSWLLKIFINLCE